MEYKFNLGLYSGVFAVPDCVVDNYIKIATGDNLKILLYSLRHCGQDLSAGEISRATGVPPDNVITSLEFWKQQSLFMESAKPEQPSSVSATASTASISANFGTVPHNSLSQAEKARQLLKHDYEFSPSEITDLIKNSEKTDYLYKRAEELYGRLLKPHEQSTLAVIVEQIGMRAEVAVMLLEYCFSIGKKRTNNIKDTAQSWLELGIDSVESAESHLKQLKEYHSIESELVRLLKIKDIPDKYKPLFQKWLFEFNFPVQIIYDAYQITLEETGKLRYNYLDKILCNWNENGIRAKKKGSGVVTKETAPITAPSFDLDELDKQIMEENKKGLKYGI